MLTIRHQISRLERVFNEPPYQSELDPPVSIRPQSGANPRPSSQRLCVSGLHASGERSGRAYFEVHKSVWLVPLFVHFISL